MRHPVMINAYTLRPDADYLAEQAYLRKRVEQIEKGMGKLAGRAREPQVITQQMDALDRARELTGSLAKQVRVRPLAEAVRAQKEWLERARAHQGDLKGEPRMAFNRIELDLRLLDEILAGWQAPRN